MSHLQSWEKAKVFLDEAVEVLPIVPHDNFKLVAQNVVIDNDGWWVQRALFKAKMKDTEVGVLSLTKHKGIELKTENKYYCQNPAQAGLLPLVDYEKEK